jgi:PAS domain-containing protein
MTPLAQPTAARRGSWPGGVHLVAELERRGADAEPLRRLFDLSVDMLGTATTDGWFTHLNPAWERTLGWSVEELMAEPFLSFVHPDDVEATVEMAPLRIATARATGIIGCSTGPERSRTASCTSSPRT